MGEKELILIADDDENERNVVRNAFDGTLHKVVAEAGSYQGVINALRKFNDTPFSGAILDGNMGEATDGEDAARQIKKSNPEVWIIARSGEPQGWPDMYIRKSLDTEELVRAVDEIRPPQE